MPKWILRSCGQGSCNMYCGILTKTMAAMQRSGTKWLFDKNPSLDYCTACEVAHRLSILVMLRMDLQRRVVSEGVLFFGPNLRSMFLGRRFGFSPAAEEVSKSCDLCHGRFVAVQMYMCHGTIRWYSTRRHYRRSRQSVDDPTAYTQTLLHVRRSM
jgi:hypothetical protein